MELTIDWSEKLSFPKWETEAETWRIAVEGQGMPFSQIRGVMLVVKLLKWQVWGEVEMKEEGEVKVLSRSRAVV